MMFRMTMKKPSSMTMGCLTLCCWMVQPVLSSVHVVYEDPYGDKTAQDSGESVQSERAQRSSTSSSRGLHNDLHSDKPPASATEVVPVKTVDRDPPKRCRKADPSAQRANRADRVTKRKEDLFGMPQVFKNKVDRCSTKRFCRGKGTVPAADGKTRGLPCPACCAQDFKKAVRTGERQLHQDIREQIYRAPPVDTWKPTDPDCGDHCKAIVRCTCCFVCCCWLWTCIPGFNECCEPTPQTDWSRVGDANLKAGQDFPNTFKWDYTTRRCISPDGVGFPLGSWCQNERIGDLWVIDESEL